MGHRRLGLLLGLCLALGAAHAKDSGRELASAPTAPSPKTLSDWYACQDDKDCVAVDGACSAACVNSKFSKDSEKYFTGLRTIVECASAEPTKAQVRARCFEKKCKCDRK